MFTPQRLAASLDLLLAACRRRAATRSATVRRAERRARLHRVARRAGAAGAHAGSADRALRAIHVDHGLHADSALWAQACRELAPDARRAVRDVRVDACRGSRAKAPRPRRARRATRRWRDRLEPGEVLLTAHHADDQLETVLLQWLRGGGLRAVAGMAPLGRFGATAWHARPLLDFTRDELLPGPAAGPALARGSLESRSPLRPQLPAARSAAGAAAALARRRRDGGRVADTPATRSQPRRPARGGSRRGSLAGATLELDALRRCPSRGSAPCCGPGSPGWGCRRRRPHAGGVAARHAMAAADRIPETRWPGVVVRRYRGRLHAEARGRCRAERGQLVDGRW